MREFLDAVLAFIGSTSLTDEEYGFCQGEIDDTSDNVANYETLLGVLDLREAVSSMKQRLQYYYLAKGVEVDDPSNAKSNILIGSAL
jgi:hypothetical protein